MMDDRQSAANANMPLVSICIPTYNRSMKLMRAINSLHANDYRNLEIIVSDNASSDDTQRLCAELSASDARIRYFRHPENVGPTRNFEFARAQAQGEYFMWLADDDWIDPRYISLCVQALEGEPLLVLAAGLGAYHRDDGLFAYHGNIIEANSSLPALRVMKYLWRVWDNSMFYGVYRRSMVEECKMPNFLAGDWAWVADVLWKGKARIIESVSVHRELGGTSSTLDNINAVLGSTGWHRSVPWIAISYSISAYLARDSGGRGIFMRTVVFVTTFFVSFFKVGNLKLMISQIPYARKVYRTISPKA